jgi:hypothetical protein
MFLAKSAQAKENRWDRLILKLGRVRKLLKIRELILRFVAETKLTRAGGD